MLKHVYKIMGLIIVFVAALWFFSEHIEEVNSQLSVETIESSGESFPVVSIYSGKDQINRMYGYSSNIVANTIRESITTVDSSKQIKVAIKEFNTSINKVAFELRDSDGTLLDSGAVSALNDEDDFRTLGIKFGCELNASKEYSLKLVLVTSVSKKINYYTRIKYYSENCHLKEKLDFVKMIHDYTINKNEKIAYYMEPDGGKDNSSLSYTNLNSSYANMTWGELNPTVLTDIVPTVKEINMETAAIQLVYYVQAETDSGMERMYVKEYYRVRYTPERLYLLWFERTLESDLDEKLASLNKSQLNLGITDKTDMQIVSNDAVTRVSFVKDSDVYMYDLTTNELNKVYSAYINDDNLEHELYRQQDARIISMDEEGNVTFALYGYIAHGGYEGKVAVLLYKYHTSEKALEELLYIPFETSYQILKENFYKYSYISGKEIFYFMADGQIYSYNIISGKLTLIAKDLNEDNMTVLENKNVIAWEENGSLSMLNLESGDNIKIPAAEGEYIKLVGNINGNVVFLRGHRDDMRLGIDGSIKHNMKSLEIIDNGGGSVKTYKSKNAYIRDAHILDNVIYIDRVKKKGKSFVNAAPDNIINRQTVKKEAVSLTSRVSNRSLTAWYMAFPSSFEMKEVPNEIPVNQYLVNEEHVLYLDDLSDRARYYVYAKGEVKASYPDACDAVIHADEEQGVVCDNNSQIVWERGGKFNLASVPGVPSVRTGKGLDSVKACEYALLKSQNLDISTKEIADSEAGIMDTLSKYLKEPLNLTGCSLDEVLYMVSGGVPVIGMKDRNNAIMITGYNQSMVTVYDPSTGLSQNLFMETANQLFAGAGNVFYSSLKGEKE